MELDFSSLGLNESSFQETEEHRNMNCEHTIGIEYNGPFGFRWIGMMVDSRSIEDYRQAWELLKPYLRAEMEHQIKCRLHSGSWPTQPTQPAPVSALVTSA